MRTSWNSSSEGLGPSVDGATVPPTRPEALTWGNKFPISSDPALFLLLPSKPKGPTLKNAGWGWGALADLTVGSEKRGEIFQFFNFLFHVLYFVKRLGFRFPLVCLSVEGNEMGCKGIVSLTPLLCALPAAQPRASAHSVSSTLTAYLVLAPCSAGHGKPPQRRKWLASPGQLFSICGQPCSKNTACQPCCSSSCPPRPQPWLQATVALLSHLIRQYPC